MLNKIDCIAIHNYVIHCIKLFWWFSQLVPWAILQDLKLISEHEQIQFTDCRYIKLLRFTYSEQFSTIHKKKRQFSAIHKQTKQSAYDSQTEWSIFRHSQTVWAQFLPITSRISNYRHIKLSRFTNNEKFSAIHKQNKQFVYHSQTEWLIFHQPQTV